MSEGGSGEVKIVSTVFKERDLGEKMGSYKYVHRESQHHPDVSVKAKGPDGMMFCGVELNLARGN